MPHSRRLVAYYSLTGTTQRVAERLAHWLDADLEVLHDRGPRRGALGALRSALDSALGREVWLAPPLFDPANYDLVLVGSPVWYASVSSPVRSYLSRYRDRLRNVAFFCTCGGTGAPRALRHMAKACGRPPLATLVVRAAHAQSGAWEGAAAAFLARLESLVQPAGARALAPTP
jgi:flavodoxin